MTVLDLVPVEQITAQARQARFGRTMLALIAWLLVGLGKLAFHVLAGVWLVMAWVFTAVRVGWNEARAADALKRGDGVERP